MRFQAESSNSTHTWKPLAKLRLSSPLVTFLFVRTYFFFFHIPTQANNAATGSDKAHAEYTVTLVTDKQKLLTGYKVKSPILELNKIVELQPLFLKELTAAGEEMKALRSIEGIRQEFEDAVKENLGYVKNPKMEIHNKFPEFVQRFLSHYEGLVICGSGTEQ